MIQRKPSLVLHDGRAGSSGQGSVRYRMPSHRNSWRSHPAPFRPVLKIPVVVVVGTLQLPFSPLHYTCADTLHCLCLFHHC